MRHRRNRQRSPGGHFNFEDETSKTRVFGFGHGDSIRLEDAEGNVWMGKAEPWPDDAVRYTFRNDAGRVMTGMADGYCIVLRDAKGRTWRGFVE